MTLVLIGVDPHKGSHTAFAIDLNESSLAELKRGARSALQYRLVSSW